MSEPARQLEVVISDPLIGGDAEPGDPERPPCRRCGGDGLVECDRCDGTGLES